LAEVVPDGTAAKEDDDDLRKVLLLFTLVDLVLVCTRVTVEGAGVGNDKPIEVTLQAAPLGFAAGRIGCGKADLLEEVPDGVVERFVADVGPAGPPDAGTEVTEVALETDMELETLVGVVGLTGTVDLLATLDTDPAPPLVGVVDRPVTDAVDEDALAPATVLVAVRLDLAALLTAEEIEEPEAAEDRLCRFLFPAVVAVLDPDADPDGEVIDLKKSSDEMGAALDADARE
jgi:hypothetical protein